MAENKLPIFERNNYFKGKLMTATDFQLEQNYFINRRNFYNSLYYGGGVVSGLQVTRENESTLVVAPGAAVDYEGRDIAVGIAENIKFNYVPKDNKDYVYLCMRYKEKKSEKTFAPYELEQGKSSYNNLIDSYEIYFQEEKNDPIELFDTINGYDLYINRKVIFENDDFIITQSVPYFANIFSQIDIRINVIKLKKITEKISFRYKVNSEHIKSDKNESIIMSFDETLHIESQNYSLIKSVFISEHMSDDESIVIDETDFYVKVGNTVVADKPKNKDWHIKRIELDLKKHLRDLYMSQEIDGLLDKLKGLKLYLAKIYFVKKGTKYIISDILNVPFDQYVDNVPLQRLFQSISGNRQEYKNELSEEKVLDLISSNKNYILSDVSQLIKQYEKRLMAMIPQITSGVTTIKIVYQSVTYKDAKNKIKDEIELIDEKASINYEDRQRRYILTELLHKYDRENNNDILEILPNELKSLSKDNIFYSLAIDSKLGEGCFLISCSVVSSNKAYSGDANIFSQNNKMPKMDICTEQDTKTGYFVIGVRVKEPIDTQELSIAWTATRENPNKMLYDSIDLQKLVASTEALNLNSFVYMTEKN